MGEACYCRMWTVVTTQFQPDVPHNRFERKEELMRILRIHHSHMTRVQFIDTAH